GKRRRLVRHRPRSGKPLERVDPSRQVRAAGGQTALLRGASARAGRRLFHQIPLGTIKMCGLCAALNAGRAWTDAAGRPQFSKAGSPIRASDERDRLVRLANGVLQHYGLTVSDWGGSSYMVANTAGRNENVYA